MILISFIIPIYNTRKYLNKCIQNIRNQPVSENLYELIIVNDGSTDDSLSEIENIIKNQESITLVNQENKGLGAARNTGLKQAKGKYIFFLDSDDYILPNSLAPLIEEAKKDYDILGFNWAKVYADNSINIQKKRQTKINRITTGTDCMINNNLGGGIWYLFSRSFLDKHQLTMPEGIYHEDELFITKAFIYAQRVQFIDLAVYAYFQRADSITQDRDKNHQKQKIKDSLFILNEFVSLVEQGDLSQSQQRGVKRKIDSFSVDIIINLIRFGMDKHIIYNTIDHLRQLNLFPLPKATYSLKYSLFRCFFYNEKQIYLASKATRKLGLK